MQKIFISYSRKDIDFARKLAGDLEKAGYDVWWDITDLRGGDDWVRTLPAAIASSEFFIIILTPNSVESEWVRKEYTQALSLRKKIVPIMFDACDVPFALNTINYVNFMSGEYEDQFQNLLKALGFRGEPPKVTPYERAKSMIPPALRKFALPLLAGIILILAFVFYSLPKPPVTPTITPSATETDFPTATSTETATPSSTSTQTATPTKPSLTPTATKQPFETLTFCVNSLFANTINVRSGPGTNYAVLGEPLPVQQCLEFRAVNESETWLLIAPNQRDPKNSQYEGGWIFRELLGLGLVGTIDLPEITLTPTPAPLPTLIPSNVPTVTPSSTPSPTTTATDIPQPTETPTP